MMTRQSFLFLVVIIVFSSCYYPAQVVIHNKSGANKNIYVTGNKTIAVGDSLQAYDHTQTANAFSTRDYYRYGLNIPLADLDTINKTFSFLLKDQHQVIVETSWPVSKLSWGQSFIISDVDTVVLTRKSKDFKRRGGRWTYTVKGK